MDRQNRDFIILHQTQSSIAFFSTVNISHKTPDQIAQQICKILSRTAAWCHTITRAILICKTYFKHPKLNHSHELIVSFLIENNFINLRNSISQKKATTVNFEIKKVAIKHKEHSDVSIVDDNKSFSFQKYLDIFKETKDHAKDKKKENKIIFTLSDLFELIPISIPKPWGKEIWFSGIENRGISNIKKFVTRSINAQSDHDTDSIPLSWIVGCVPNVIFGKKLAHKDPILLKILDPLPIPIIGDLYYELHLEKNEVYVVLNVSNKDGKIKIGVNEKKFDAYSKDAIKYKNDFLRAILKYESVRRDIDTLKDNQQNIPQALIELEKNLRETMDDFCGFVPLKSGDVINVPTHTPHALQHGVKVLEFQTPTYERLIISFAQKVLTQSHWDTTRAFDIMKLEPFHKQALKILSKTKNLTKELVCQFHDFIVSRWTMKNHSTCQISTRSCYKILFILSGNLKVKKINEFKHQKQQFIHKHQCLLIPQKQKILLSASDDCLFLICTPV